MTIPGMSVAGRGFTSYMSNATMNNLLKKKYDIKDNMEYKEYIQKNGEAMSASLMNRNTELVKSEQWWLGGKQL
jgi:serine phosphatase RsbU (regulator of sigma subunit)